jgi:hypothetical protein
MKIIEHKTSDPASPEARRRGARRAHRCQHPRRGRRRRQGPGADRRQESAEGRAIYVRKPKEAASALAEPAVMVEPDPKRWVDRQLVDVAGAKVHDIAVKPANGPAYLLTRAMRDVEVHDPQGTLVLQVRTLELDLSPWRLLPHSISTTCARHPPPPHRHRPRDRPPVRRPGVRDRRTQGG